MNKNSRHTILLVTSIVITIILITIGLLLYQRISTYRSDIGRLSGEIEIAARQEEGAKKLLKDFKDTEDSRAALVSYFVSDDKIVNFIQVLEATGPKVGAQAEIMSLDAEDSTGKEKGTVTSARIRLEVRGSWSTVLRYVMAVERLPYVVAINNLSLRNLGGIPADGSLTPVKNQSSQWVANFELSIQKIL